MSVEQRDLIVAPATPSGHSALAVVRLTGEGAGAVASSMLEGYTVPAPRRAELRWLMDDHGRRLDQIICTAYPPGNSYTGDELVEFSLHGNPLLVRAVCVLACARGARMAQPGEFTRRAFLSGRLSLAQAEAVALLIDAPTTMAARTAARNIGGALGIKVGALREELLWLLSGLEAAIDHPEEELDLEAESENGSRLAAVLEELRQLRRGFAGSQKLFRLPRVVLSGPVNAGKSTLFNTLSRSERAITSSEPGTTRDLLEVSVFWPDRDIVLVDGAGLRENPRDQAEREGLRRAENARRGADLVLELWPWQDRDSAPAATEGIRVWTQTRGSSEGRGDDGSIAISSLEGHGMTDLADAVRERLGTQDFQEVLVTTLRQEDALKLAEERLGEVLPWVRTGSEPVIVAEALQSALQGLGEILRPCDREDVLDEVFRRFCIGK